MTERELAALSAGQLEIMKIVWEQGETTVGEVLEILTGRRRIARNTVQTTMVRLEEKGWLTHRKVANTFRYTATLPQQDALGKMVGDLLMRAFGGSVEGLVMTLLEQHDLSSTEADRIRVMIERSRHQGD